MAQGLQPDAGTAQVIPVPAQEIREQPCMPIHIKDLGLRMAVLHPHSPHEIAEGTLAAAGLSQHQELSEVAEMIDHAKEVRKLRLGIEAWATPEVLVAFWPWPHRGQARHEVRQGQRIL